MRQRLLECRGLMLLQRGASGSTSRHLSALLTILSNYPAVMQLYATEATLPAVGETVIDLHFDVSDLTSTEFKRVAKQLQCCHLEFISTFLPSSVSCFSGQRTLRLSSLPSSLQYPTQRLATASKHALSNPTGCQTSSATTTVSAHSKFSARPRVPNQAPNDSSSSRPAQPERLSFYPSRPLASIGTRHVQSRCLCFIHSQYHFYRLKRRGSFMSLLMWRL